MADTVTLPCLRDAYLQATVVTRRLVAYDGSPSAQRALDHAADLHREGDDLGLIHVGHGLRTISIELATACANLLHRGITAKPIVADGMPAHAICVAAERHGYDTIVIGRRNHADTGGVLPGSVAARVVAGAAGHVHVVA
jgi:nucleotide-binding universal stress UspA family protein